ncbi:MAG: hypothetical protein PUH69_06290, partial [Faecalibacterium prausnitzii]|nr:hypothetical protein [Faecalibacterium prausnitzii]
MTNKKFKLAATAVALTACVAAQPLAAHATTADEVDAAPADAKQEDAAADENQQTPAEEAPVNKEDPKKATPVLGEGETEVKYDHENPIQNPDDSTTLKGDIIKKDESAEEKPEEKPEVKPEKKAEEKPEEKVPTGDTTEEKKDLTEEGKKIGEAEKTEKVDTETTEQKPNPGAEPIPDTTKKPTTDINLDGSLTRKDPVVTPGTETSTTTGTGNAKADLDEVVTETPKENISLEKELGKVNPDIAWDAAKDTDVGNGYKVQEVKNDATGTKQTLVLRKEETKTGEMTAEEIAKLLEADKPTVNADGSYTLTRTEKYLDEKGNEQTRTTNITVTGSTVTIKTTTDLTVSREKFENDGEATIPTDVVLAGVQLSNGGGSLPYTKLDEMLTETGGKDANGVKDGTYTYTETAKDGTVRKYTITIDTTSTDQLTNDEIVAKLNNDRYSVEGGDIYYRADNGERVKLTVDQNTALRRNLSIEVSVTETKNGTTETSGKEKAENDVKDAALREALYEAASSMVADNDTLAKLKKEIDAGTFDRDKGGVFTTTVDGKTYSFTYQGAKVETTAVKDAVDPTVPGKDPDKITDVKDHTLAGSAVVTHGKVTWTDTETGNYHEVTGDGGDSVPTPPAGTETYTDTNGNTCFDVVTTDQDGHKVTTTYTITYSKLTDTEKEALAWDALLKEHPGKTKEDLIAEGYKNVRFEGDVTKAEWTVTKKTEGTNVTT